MSAEAEQVARAEKEELIALAEKGGALVVGVADATAFDVAPKGHRPTDLLPKAKTVLVLGGAQPRAGDWASPNYQHMEIASTSDRISSLALKLAHHIERQFGYYAVTAPPGVDLGQQPFLSISLAAELAGCGTRSIAGPVLHPEHGFMYFSAIVTTLSLEVDGPLSEPVCPAPECVDMWDEQGKTPCMRVCPIESNGCLGGRLENGRIAERQYNRGRCMTRVYNYWVPGFQKALATALDEPDKARRRMILGSTFFTRTLWSMTYSNVSQGQCYECMRVCPVGRKHRELR